MTIQIAPSSYHPIHRQNGSTSLQPRFSEINPSRFFTSLMKFANANIQNEPEYGSRDRDNWLRRVWPQEPYLAGVINSVTNIDKNRGWTVKGGRNQVKRFVDILHDRFFYAPDLSGWRMSFGGSALSYYTADIGSVTEIGRSVRLTSREAAVFQMYMDGCTPAEISVNLGIEDINQFLDHIDRKIIREGSKGPLDSLYFVDPVRCELIGDFETPLKYYPEGRGNGIKLKRDDYFRVVSMPSTDEATFGLGLCALSRCIELAKIMIGIYQYDNEMLLNRAPRGLLLLKGITEQQWEDAMATREAKLEGKEQKYYGAVAVLASETQDISIEAQLTALSSLPAEFDQRTFTDLLMYGYALCFGYDPREFWPVSAGALGTATETETQHRKAGAKGALDFTLGYAENLNREMPETILFEFEERDMDGELANALLEQAQSDVVTGIYGPGLKEGLSLIDKEEGRIMLADRGIIDPDWTVETEDTIADDEGEERALDNERIQKAIYKFPDEDIVQYRFSIENGREVGQYKTIYKPQARRRSFLMTPIQRQVNEEIEDYQQQIDTLAHQANNGEISQAEFEERLNALAAAILTLSMLRGLNGETDAAQLLTDAALMVLENDSPEANEIGLETLTDPVLLEEAMPEEANDELQEEIALGLASGLAVDIFANRYEFNSEGLTDRMAMWGITAGGLHTAGRLIAGPTTLFRWDLGGTTNHCNDCFGFDGVVMTGAEWRSLGLRPQSRDLECKGYHCDCSLPEV